MRVAVARVLTLALVLIGISAGMGSGPTRADNRDVPPWPSPWRAATLRDHTLTGKIWSRAAGGVVTPQAYGTALAKSRFVLLGEVHDNPDHHRLQAWAIHAISKLRGARIAEGAPQAHVVALEMLSADDKEALDRFYGRNARVPRPRTAEDFGRLLKWDKLGWPDYAMYQPIIAQALSNFLVISPANPARAETRAVAKDGWSALPGGEAKRLGLEADLGKANADALATEIAEGHCGLLPASSLPAMSRVQRLRDARMADALLVAGEWKGGILIAGNGHVRRDRAVPWYMQERGIADGEITAVMHVEVSEGETDPTAYLGKLGGEGPVADFVVFTPRTERPDPCETMREHMSKMKKQG